MGGEHAAQHDKVSAAAKRFGDVAGHGAAAVAADVPAKSVRSVGAFDDGGELRVADAGHFPCGADAAGADANFHDVCTCEDQRFGDVGGDDVARHDRGFWIGLAEAFDKVDEGFGVAVCYVDTDEFDGVASRAFHGLEFIEIRVGDAERVERVLVHRVVVVVEEGDVILDQIVLVQRDVHVVSGKRGGHFEGADGVHVRRDDRHCLRVATGVAIGVIALQFHLGARTERGALWAEQDVFEIKLQFFFDTHRNYLM